MLILSRKVGESILLNDDIEIFITEIVGDKVKVGIQAPMSVKVLRKEIYQTVESNKQAAHNVNGEQLAGLASLISQKEKNNYPNI